MPLSLLVDIGSLLYVLVSVFHHDWLTRSNFRYAGVTICIKIITKSRNISTSENQVRLTKFYGASDDCGYEMYKFRFSSVFFLSIGIVTEFNKINVTLAKIHSSLLQEKRKMQTLDCLTNTFHVAVSLCGN